MVAETEGAVADTEKDEIEETRLDHQAFLLDRYEEFVRYNTTKTYPSFVQLQGDPGTLTNKLLGQGANEMLNIAPHQLSLLQPKIKLFKSRRNQEPVELFFDDFINFQKLEVITKNRSQRGTGIGLKSFDWDDMGTNPGDTGKAFSATLQIQLQSISDLFSETKEGVSFADLIRTPPTEFNETGVFNENSYRILAQIGWMVPSEATRIISEKLRKSIEKSSITLFLTLTNHEIDYQENGSINLTINYIGAIEGKMLSPSQDILYIGAPPNPISVKMAQKQVKLLERKIKTFSEDPNTKKTGLFQKILGNQTKEELENEENEEQLELARERVEMFSNSREGLIRENKAKSYKRLLNELEKKGRIFHTDISQDQIDVFRMLKNTSFAENLTDAEIEKEKAEKLFQIRKYEERVRTSLDIYSSSDVENPLGGQALEDTLSKFVKAKNEEDRDRIIDDSKSQNVKSRDSKPKSSKKTRIHFIYFGDLIDVALSVLESVQREKGINPIGDDKFRFLLGTFELIDFRTQKRREVDLCDVPISLDLFNAWFLRKVIRPQLEKYLLRDFLSDVCSELIVRAISPNTLGGFSKGIVNRVSFSVFSLSDNAENQLTAGSRININNFDTENIKQGSIKNTKSYMLIYISGISSSKLRGNYEEDAKRGIYHFFVGADRGILKRVKFSRTDMQYLKEARITNAEKTRDGDLFLSEPYNASLDLAGSTIFKPGMMVYLDPNSLGFGSAVEKRKRLPIGGYYTIIKCRGKIAPGLFQTSVELNFETLGNDDSMTPLTTSKNNSEKSIDSVI